MRTADLINKRFGVNTRAQANPLVAAVGTSITKILPNNPNRLSAVIVNLSANNLYISWDNEPASDHGIFLAPNGGVFTMNVDEDFELVCWEVNAIASGVGSAIFVEEVVIDQTV